MARDEQHDDEIIEALRFVKVAVREGIHDYAGYLLPISGKMLLVQLERDGFEIIKRRSR